MRCLGPVAGQIILEFFSSYFDYTQISCSDGFLFLLIIRKYVFLSDFVYCNFFSYWWWLKTFEVLFVASSAWHNEQSKLLYMYVCL